MTAVSVFVANHSSYPRIGEKAEEQKLRRAIERFDRKEISPQELDEAARQVIREVISEQEKAGLDLVTDGQVRWADPISHWVKGFQGVRLGGLLRFFDTNCYFRVPRISRLGKPLDPQGSLLRGDLAFSVRVAKRPVKAVLTGPVTTAVLSERKAGFGKIEELIDDLTLLAVQEVASLAEEGASWIQIDEPILPKKPDLFSLVSRVLKALEKRKGKAKILLTTFFGDASPLYEKLQDLPTDGLGFDCIYSRNLLEKIVAEGSEKTLFLGVVDGRSTRLETMGEGDLVKKLRRVYGALAGRELALTSSCGLEYLPRARAFEKLTILTKLKEAIS